MLILKRILSAGLLDGDSEIGSLKVRMVCDQWVGGVYGDVDKTVGVCLQNLVVKPVSNHRTTPWHEVDSRAELGSNSTVAVKSTSSGFMVTRSKVWKMKNL